VFFFRSLGQNRKKFFFTYIQVSMIQYKINYKPYEGQYKIIIAIIINDVRPYCFDSNLDTKRIS
jgi:hypothetical protein